ncbi:DoxX family membrane protein [Nonomuraea sp. NPDC046570]|uniref:DoxX family protein n=1 Tax=Nonomuraea sp. NPDC046570 TaxID=3155255 RepID=UPI0033FC2CFE
MKRVLFDIAALISRVTIGVIFLAHGLQKWQGAGLEGITQGFTQLNIPLPQLAAGFTMTAETIGGLFLIIGLLVPLAALAVLGVALGALIFVHAPNGIFIADGGWELVGALGAACLLLAVLGGGRFSVDGLLLGAYRRRNERRAAEAEAARAPIPVTEEPAYTETDTTPAATEPTAPMAGPATPARDETAADTAAPARGESAEAGETPSTYGRSDADDSGTPPQSEVTESGSTSSPGLPRQREPGKHAAPGGEPGSQGLSGPQSWSEEERKDIDALLADNPRRKDRG